MRAVLCVKVHALATDPAVLTGPTTLCAVLMRQHLDLGSARVASSGLFGKLC